MIKRLRLLLLLNVVLLLQDTASANAYTIERISINGQATRAGALNEKGEVVVVTGPGNVVGNEIDGYDLDPPAAVWKIDNTTEATKLIGSGGPQDNVYDLNDAGVAAGTSKEAFLVGPPLQAVVWDGTVANVLPAPPGPVGITRAVSINNAGQVLVTKQSDPRTAFLYSTNDGYTPLPVMAGMSVGASDINNLGQVVGGYSSPSADPNPMSMPFLWDVNGVTDLGSLGGTHGNAIAINEVGQIAGASQTATGVTHAFLWDEANGMIDLGTMHGLWSVATDVNDSGIVIGTLFDPQISQPEIPFIYDELNGMRELEDIIPANSGWQGPFRAVSINNRGQILGSGQFEGRSQAFLLTPVPEPTTVVILLSGLLITLKLRAYPRPQSAWPYSENLLTGSTRFTG